MKRVYVNEKWCLGCHLCEYICAFANSGERDRVPALQGVQINPRLRIEEGDGVSFAVSCRHCADPICVKSCITGSLTIQDGAVMFNREKCVGCYTCILACPYGAVMPSDEGAVQKCELCLKNSVGQPACVTACPNRAIVYEERD